MLDRDQWFASGQVMPRLNVPAVTPLLQQLLDHPQRHPEATRYLLPRYLSLVVGLQNPFP